MRIVFLAWRDTTHPDGGGSEVYVEEVAARLVEAGHEVTLRCATYPGAPRVEWRRGVRIVRAGGRLGVYARGLAWLLSREARRTDVVVDVVNAIGFAAPLVRRRGLLALIHHVHREQWHIIYPGLIGRIGWLIESRLVPRLYRDVPTVTVSEPSRADLEALGLRDLRVVHNGTPPLPVPRVELSATPRLIVLSRLVPHKQVEHAVDVAVALRERFPDLVLDVVGDGWWADRIAEHVQARRAGDVVELHGHVDEQTKSDLLARAWVCLVPSVREGWCIVVLEAAREGTPTIAYRSAGGVTESVQDGVTGLLVDDLDGMVHATTALLEQADRRTQMAKAARERATGFTWEETSARFEAALRQAHSP
ncbi:glycosyltransferase family 4 protein [Alteromonas gracilis]